MSSDDDTADEAVATATDRPSQVVGPAAPPVTLLVVTHAPGAWFDDVLAALAALEYPALEVVVADAASPDPVDRRVHEVLPDATVLRLEDNLGYGRSVDAALAQIDASPLVVLAHDDVAPEPEAVRHLVEEAFRSNAAVVGPKTLRWTDPSRLLSVGEGADKFGYPVPYVERDELDQEQHDAVRDVFTVPDAFTLVRRDLLEAVGGFDDEGSWFGDDLDLCWRAHVAGGRVMVAPSARVRHVEALGERRPIDDRRRHQFRHRTRTMLGCYGAWSLVRVVPQLLVVHAVEILFALVTGRPGQARDVATAWTWNLRRMSSLRRRRAQLAAVRRVRDAEVRSLQVRGSARVAAFLRGQLSVGDDPLGSAATMSRRLVDGVAGPGRRTAFLAWMVVGLVVVVGSRHLLTRPIPAVGEMVPFPEQISPLLQEWWASWRRAGLGADGFAASADLVGAVGLTAFLGAGGLFRTVVLVGMLPLGLYGAWRLVAPTHSIRASVLGLVAYAAVPVGYDSFATGSWRGLLAYGITPWVVARLVRASGTAPFGADDPPAGPRVAVPPLWRQCVVLGVVVALAATVDPLWVVIPLGIVVAMVPGALAAGSFRGLGRMGISAAVGGLVALALHGPWALELLVPGADWSSFSGGGVTPDPVSVLDVVSFDTGPIGTSVLGAALVVAAMYVLLVGRGWRLGWAARGWSIALVCWGLVLADGRGWLPFHAPDVEVLLAPAGAALAMCVGLGAAAFDFDVRRRDFSWRQLVGVVALASLGLAFLPVVSAAVGGRWDMPRSDHAEAVSFLDEEAADSSFRVLWLGAPEVLPLGSWPLVDGDASSEVSYATTIDGVPVFQDGWPGPPEADDAPLRQALELALDLDTTRLGRILAPAGVRYVVVVESGAPAPYGGVSAPVPDSIIDALEQQLDLARIELNPDLTLYRNAAWAPRVAALPAGTIPDDTAGGTAWMRQAMELDLAATSEPLEGTGPASASGSVEPETEVLVGSSPVDGWEIRVDGSTAPQAEALGWTTTADTAAGGEVEVSWSTPLVHRLVLAVQLAVIVVVAVVLYATRAEARDRRRSAARRRAEARTTAVDRLPPAEVSGSRRDRRSAQRAAKGRRSR